MLNGPEEFLEHEGDIFQPNPHIFAFVQKVKRRQDFVVITFRLYTTLAKSPGTPGCATL